MGVELTMEIKSPLLGAIERLPQWVRVLVGCLIAVLSVSLTYFIQPLRAFPLLLAFPTVVLSSWFLGMYGGIACAIVDVILVDAFLTRRSFASLSDRPPKPCVCRSFSLSPRSWDGWWGVSLISAPRCGPSSCSSGFLLSRPNINWPKNAPSPAEPCASAMKHCSSPCAPTAWGSGCGTCTTEIVSCSEEVYRAMGLPPGPTDVHSIVG